MGQNGGGHEGVGGGLAVDVVDGVVGAGYGDGVGVGPVGVGVGVVDE